MIVFDASALLAFLANEPGADSVREALEVGPSACSAANWSEVAHKVMATGHNWRQARALLMAYDLAVEPVIATDAESAAELWQTNQHLSLADRLCLALAARLEAPAWTADRLWGTRPGVRQIR